MSKDGRKEAHCKWTILGGDRVEDSSVYQRPFGVLNSASVAVLRYPWWYLATDEIFEDIHSLATLLG